MDIGNLNDTALRFPKAPHEKCCPECGAKMREIDGRNENGVLFVWHECSRKDCDGQWLQKIPQEFQ